MLFSPIHTSLQPLFPSHFTVSSPLYPQTHSNSAFLLHTSKRALLHTLLCLILHTHTIPATPRNWETHKHVQSYQLSLTHSQLRTRHIMLLWLGVFQLVKILADAYRSTRWSLRRTSTFLSAREGVGMWKIHFLMASVIYTSDSLK